MQGTLDHRGFLLGATSAIRQQIAKGINWLELFRKEISNRNPPLAEGIAGAVGLDGTQVLGLLDQHMQLAALGAAVRLGGHRLDAAAELAQVRGAARQRGATREERRLEALRGMYLRPTTMSPL